MDIRDEVARLKAETDQGIESAKEMGRTLHGFYAGLIDAGFSADQALALTQIFLSQSIQTNPAQQIAEWFKEMGEGEK